MDQQELIDKARALGLNEHVLQLPKKSLVQAIQQAQGQNPCFLSDNRYFCDASCEWGDQCKALTAAWLR